MYKKKYVSVNSTGHNLWCELFITLTVIFHTEKTDFFDRDIDIKKIGLARQVKVNSSEGLIGGIKVIL